MMTEKWHHPEQVIKSFRGAGEKGEEHDLKKDSFKSILF